MQTGKKVYFSFGYTTVFYFISAVFMAFLCVSLLPSAYELMQKAMASRHLQEALFQGFRVVFFPAMLVVSLVFYNQPSFLEAGPDGIRVTYLIPVSGAIMFGRMGEYKNGFSLMLPYKAIRAINAEKPAGVPDLHIFFGKQSLFLREICSRDLLETIAGFAPQISFGQNAIRLMKPAKKAGGNTEVSELDMKDILKLASEKELAIGDKRSVLERCLSDTDYFYSHRPSPYTGMCINFGRQLMEASPEDAEPAIMTGNVLSWLKNDRGAAAEYYLTALKLKPDCMLYRKVIVSLCFAGKFNEADRYLKIYESSNFSCMEKDEVRMIKDAIKAQKIKYDADMTMIADYDWPEE